MPAPLVLAATEPPEPSTTSTRVQGEGGGPISCQPLGVSGNQTPDSLCCLPGVSVRTPGWVWKSADQSRKAAAGP